ncbi:hypothetical protein TgHK011_006199 [Trichoderma gracile]|nr:hypothetical protein TgHK011_006199 [Trichoderma gracile]
MDNLGCRGTYRSIGLLLSSRTQPADGLHDAARMKEKAGLRVAPGGWRVGASTKAFYGRGFGNASPSEHACIEANLSDTELMGEEKSTMSTPRSGREDGLNALQ